MKSAKILKLKKKGWKIGDASDFLENARPTLYRPLIPGDETADKILDEYFSKNPLKVEKLLSCRKKVSSKKHAHDMFSDDKIANSRAQKYLWNIWAIGCDYDGETTVKGLKSVITEMLINAQKAMKELKDVAGPVLKKFKRIRKN